MQILRTPPKCILALIVAGCASYEPTRTSVPEVGEYVTRISEEGITLAAEPCVDQELQRSLFDADLREAGIVAINVLVRNETDRPVVARRTDMNLVLPDGRQLRPASAQNAAVRVGEGGSPTAMMLGFGIFGSIAADNAEETARMARITDYRLKQFEGLTISANDSAQGYVYFILTSNSKDGGFAHFDVRIVDMEGLDVVTLSAPIDSVALVVKESYDAIPTHRIR